MCPTAGLADILNEFTIGMVAIVDMSGFGWYHMMQLSVDYIKVNDNKSWGIIWAVDPDPRSFRTWGSCSACVQRAHYLAVSNVLSLSLSHSVFLSLSLYFIYIRRHRYSKCEIMSYSNALPISRYCNWHYSLIRIWLPWFKTPSQSDFEKFI